MAMAKLPLQQEARVCLVLVSVHTFRVNPHFDLEPDYIKRKGIQHRIQRYIVRSEILPIFHTRVDYQSVCQCIRMSPL